MRIALISMHTSPAAVPGSGDAGGMNVVIAEAARALAARGHEVVTVTRSTSSLPPGEYPLGETFLGEDQDASADRDPSTDRAHRADGAAGHLPPSLVALRAGSPTLRKEELPSVIPEFADGLRRLGPFDAVHAHYWLSGVAATTALAGHVMGPAKIAVTFHTLAALKNAHLAPTERPEPGERVEAERALARRSFVVAGSRNELLAVRDYCGEPPVGSGVVHPGVDTDLFRSRPQQAPHAPAELPVRSTAQARSAAQAHPAPLRLTVLGRVQPLKGQDLAIRAFGEFVQMYPELGVQSELIIAGEPTPGAEQYAARLPALANEYGIADRVKFLSAHTREQSAVLLASSTVVIVPSHSETFGLTALEAAACGVPVIAGGHTGLLEAAPEGVAGVHVRGRDPRDWARALADLLASPHRRASLSHSARAHATGHDWSAHAAALERIYTNLAS